MSMMISKPGLAKHVADVKPLNCQMKTSLQPDKSILYTKIHSFCGVQLTWSHHSIMTRHLQRRYNHGGKSSSNICPQGWWMWWDGNLVCMWILWCQFTDIKYCILLATRNISDRESIGYSLASSFTKVLMLRKIYPMACAQFPSPQLNFFYQHPCTKRVKTAL